jgi:hypothetical protein
MATFTAPDGSKVVVKTLPERNFIGFGLRGSDVALLTSANY